MKKGLSFFEKLKNKLTVRAENNPGVFMFLLIIAANIVFIAFSTLLLLFLPENKGRSFTEMLRFAFTLMVNPSGRYQYSDYPISLIITTIVVLLGNDIPHGRYCRFYHKHHHQRSRTLCYFTQTSPTEKTYRYPQLQPQSSLCY